MTQVTPMKTMSPEVFAALYAPESFDIPALPSTAHGMIMDKLDPAARETVESCYHYYKNPHNMSVKVQLDTSGADDIHSAEYAAETLERVMRAERELQNAMKKVETLKVYYEQLTALLAATVKIETVYISRNVNRYGDGKVTYELHTGYYDKTLKNHVITGWRVAQFTGKDHRIARAAFEKLVKETPGAYGYEISDNYYSHLGESQYIIKS